MESADKLLPRKTRVDPNRTPACKKVVDDERINMRLQGDPEDSVSATPTVHVMIRYLRRINAL